MLLMRVFMLIVGDELRRRAVVNSYRIFHEIPRTLLLGSPETIVMLQFATPLERGQ